MKKMNSKQLILALVIANVGAANAQVLNLSRAPLFVRPQVPSNIILTFDDSGSMRDGITPNELRSSRIFNPVTAPGNPDFPLELCVWRDFPYAYSSATNGQYYDPTALYIPPVRANGSSFPAAVFTAARRDGFDTASATRNLATRYVFTIIGSDNDNNVVTFTRAGVAPSATCGTQITGNNPGAKSRVYPSPAVTATTNIFRAFYFTHTPNTALYDPNNYTFTAVKAAEEGNFANWYSYYRTRNLMARTAATIAFSQLSKDVRVAWQGMTNSQLNGSFVIASIGDADHRTAFFNYLNSVPANSGTPTRSATARVGSYVSDDNKELDASNPYYDAVLKKEISCRQNFHMLFTDGGWKDDIGGFNDRNFDQQAFGPFPDTQISFPYTGIENYTSVYTSGSNQRNIGGFADLAFRYWSRDLRSNLDNNVVPFLDDRTTGVTGPVVPVPTNPFTEPEIFWNPKNDPATWQHLVQFIVAFGLSSSLEFPDDLVNLRQGTKSWTDWAGGAADSRENLDRKEKVDDTWHAALNSRGELLSASNPQQLVNQMNAVFQAVSNRTANVAQGSVSSGLFTTSLSVFRTFFNASSWSGTVRAIRFNGTTEVVQWDAGCWLTGGPCAALNGSPVFDAQDPKTRKIYTVGVAKGEFEWDNMTVAQKNQLNFDFDQNVTDANGPKRLAFLRGSRADEGTLFRTRESVLGAIITSSALVVGGPNDIYWTASQDESNPVLFPDGSENKTNFRAHVEGTIKDREKLASTVYVGANDGMLHAFDASTGKERWAYVPSMLYRQLSRYTSKSSLFFQPGVDAAPVVREAYVDNEWKTMLVSTLRGGGQGVFALDVTDPSPDVGAETRIMWEFSDANDADMGYTYGQPFITRANNGKWVVLVPGGYNSSDATDPVSGASGWDSSLGSGKAVLFVLDAATGAVIRKFDLGPGTSGLGSVTAGDYVLAEGEGDEPKQVIEQEGENRTFDQITDVAFAGDNEGNVWRFDLRSETASAWEVRKFVTLPAGQRLSSAPRLASSNGLAVVGFGTGRFVTLDDRTEKSRQAIYGVFDNGPDAAAVLLGDLTEQTLTQVVINDGPAFATTRNEVEGSAGWYFKLKENSGERVVNQPTFLAALQAYVIPSFTPSTQAVPDPCVESSISNFYIVNVGTGGPATQNGVASFDVNNDGVINSNDSALISGFSVKGFLGGATSIINSGGGGSILLGDGQSRPPCVGDSCACTGNACTNPPSLVPTNSPQWRQATRRELPTWDANERN
jgi:type IV pilus assembly protein PilY1